MCPPFQRGLRTTTCPKFNIQHRATDGNTLISRQSTMKLQTFLFATRIIFSIYLTVKQCEVANPYLIINLFKNIIYTPTAIWRYQWFGKVNIQVYSTHGGTEAEIKFFDMAVLIQWMCFSFFSLLAGREKQIYNNIMIIACGGGGGAFAGPRLEKSSAPSQPLSERMRLLLKYAVGQNGLFKDTANKLRHVMSIKAQVWSWHRSSFFPPSSSSFQA